MKMLRLVLALALLPVASFGVPILSWDFESGSPSFASDLLLWAPAPPLRLQAGHYSIAPSPVVPHDLLMDFGDHTTGSGNMMVVNGATAPTPVVWDADLGTNGTTLYSGVLYSLSFWVAKAYTYDNSPAQLWVEVDGSRIGGIVVPSQPGWQNFTATFISPSGSPTIRIVNDNMAAAGNDFALDDITLHQPEPSAWMMGIGGVAAMLLLRRRRRA